MKCWIRGCKEIAVSGGFWKRDTDSSWPFYVRMCHQHFIDSIKGIDPPRLKRRALEYEVCRNRDRVHIGLPKSWEK